MLPVPDKWVGEEEEEERGKKAEVNYPTVFSNVVRVRVIFPFSMITTGVGVSLWHNLFPILLKKLLQSIYFMKI